MRKARTTARTPPLGRSRSFLLAILLATGCHQGVDPSDPLVVESELEAGADGYDRVRFHISAPNGHVRFFGVVGPGECQATGESLTGTCGHLTADASQRASCECVLRDVSESVVSYRVFASGKPSRVFPSAEDDPVTLDTTVEIARPLAFEFNTRRGTTILRGSSGSFDISQEGNLRFSSSEQLTLHVGDASGAGPFPSVPLDALAIAQQEGIAAVLRGQSYVSVPTVRLQFPDGRRVEGTVRVPARGLVPSIVSLLEERVRNDMPAPDGRAIIWLDETNVRRLSGEPDGLEDIGTVIRVHGEAEDIGTCGPYHSFTGAGFRARRTRWVTTVQVHSNTLRNTTRRFRGPRPSCPGNLQAGTRTVDGERNQAEVDAYVEELFQASEP